MKSITDFLSTLTFFFLGIMIGLNGARHRDNDVVDLYIIILFITCLILVTMSIIIERGKKDNED